MFIHNKSNSANKHTKHSKHRNNINRQPHYKATNSPITDRIVLCCCSVATSPKLMSKLVIHASGDLHKAGGFAV